MRNRSPTKAVEGKTPYEAIYGVKLKVGHLRVFGCTAYSYISQDKRQKLDAKACKGIFLGYSTNRKGYRLYDQSSGKVIFSQSVKFNELVLGTEKESLTNIPTENPHVVIDDSQPPEDITTREEVEKEVEEQGDDNQKNPIEQEERTEPTVRRSQRETRRPDYYGVWLNSATVINEPNTVNEALSCSEKENWKEAMEAEFQSLNANHIWDLVPPSKDRKVIIASGC